MSDFYLTGSLSVKEQQVLDKILNLPESKLERYNRRIVEAAELRKRKSVDITLRKAQIKPVMLSLINKRFFIGDKPGLGKTVMSAASYANYQYHMLKKGKTPTKILVVTTSAHVKGFSNEWESYGIRLLPLLDGSTKIRRTLEREDVSEYDGLIINWDGLKTNGFLDYYLRNANQYDYAVFDETGYLISNKSKISQVVNQIVNKYAGGIKRVIFLNGSSFEKDIFDFYYQFNILHPKLIPNKAFLEENYVIRGGKPVNLLSLNGESASQKFIVSKHVGDIVDYKNQSELRQRLKYYYIARSKKDYSKDLPENTYILHGVEMTAKQKKQFKETKSTVVLNSPKTRDENATLNLKEAPKLAALIEHVDNVIEDRPLIYVYNKESQKTICEELRKKGYKVEILNGEVNGKEKEEIRQAFNNYKLDILVFNIQKALNIPTSDRILFYDIPITPEITNQVKGRIDRNNYTDQKFYEFFCYLESQEMKNIIQLAYFREKHGNAFTGQEDFTYHSLVEQIGHIYGKENVDALSERINNDQEFFENEDWEEIVDDYI